MLRLVRLPESLNTGVSDSKPLWLVRPAILAVVLVVWMEADSSVIGGRVAELVVVIVCLTLGSA